MADFNVFQDLTASQINQNYELARTKKLQDALNTAGLQYAVATADPPDNVLFGRGQTIGGGTIFSVVLGNGSQDTGEETVCIGDDAINNGNNSTVLGSDANNTNGANVVCIGKQAVNTASANVCLIGASSNNQGADVVCIGKSSQNRNASACVLGANADNTGVDTVCIGKSSVNNGANSCAIGESASCTGLDSVSIGKSCVSNGANCVVIGSSVQNHAAGNPAVAVAESCVIGKSSLNRGANSCLYGFGVENLGAQNCIYGHAAKNTVAGTHNCLYGNANETDGTYNTVLGTGNKILAAGTKPQRNVIIADGVLQANVQAAGPPNNGVQNCIYVGTHAPTGVLFTGSINLGTGVNFSPATDARLTFGGDALLDVLAGDAGVGGVGTDGYLRIRYKGADFKIPLYADV